MLEKATSTERRSRFYRLVVTKEGENIAN